MIRRAPRPLRRLVDLAVFAPVGFVVEAPRLVPKLIETGRARLARVPGLGGLSAAAVDRARSASGAPRPSPAADDSPMSGLSAAAGAPPDRDLPIPAYDQLAASQVVARLDGLDPNDLLAVERYEKTHRRRRTVLAKIAQLRKA